jgi:hypothetical protein
MVRLLEIFARQLSYFANELLIQAEEKEPYRIRLVKAYISRHQSETFSLSDVAREIHVVSRPRRSKNPERSISMYG